MTVIIVAAFIIGSVLIGYATGYAVGHEHGIEEGYRKGLEAGKSYWRDSLRHKLQKAVYEAVEDAEKAIQARKEGHEKEKLSAVSFLRKTPGSSQEIRTDHDNSSGKIRGQQDHVVRLDAWHDHAGRFKP